MIFVTVGTHEQPFDRLIRYIDNLKCNGVINEEVIIQTGFSTYEPKYCEWTNFLTYKQMKENILKANIVITHGGPASFFMPLQIGKVPIVVPRRYDYNEHVNNHQVEFIKEVSNRIGMIIPVINIDDLKEKISCYDEIVSHMNNNMRSNNEKFNLQFDEIINKLFI